MSKSFFASLHRTFLCRLERHGPAMRREGSPANFCCYCGASLRPWPKWEVKLRSGETFRVEGINEYHAGSQVVYGRGPRRIDGDTGRALSDVVVHRDNIASIKLIEPPVSP
jgi:hypothetical protein